MKQVSSASKTHHATKIHKVHRKADAFSKVCANGVRVVQKLVNIGNHIGTVFFFSFLGMRDWAGFTNFWVHEFPLCLFEITSSINDQSQGYQLACERN